MNKITTDKNIVASIPSKEEKQKKTPDGSHFYKAKQGSHVDEETVEVVELTPMLFRKAVSQAVTEDVLAPLTDSGGHADVSSSSKVRTSNGEKSEKISNH